MLATIPWILSLCQATPCIDASGRAVLSQLVKAMRPADVMNAVFVMQEPKGVLNV